MSTQFKGKLPQFEIDIIAGTDPSLERYVFSINEILGRIPRSIVGIPPIEVSIDNDRWLISLGNTSNRVPANLANFVVIEEFDDYLKCVRFDYNTGEPLIHRSKFGTVDDPTPSQIASTEGGEIDISIAALKKLMKKNQQGIFRDTGGTGEGGDIPDPPPDGGGDEGGGDGGGDEGDPPPDPPPPKFYPGYINVAKPRLMQRTPFDNNSITLRGVLVSYYYDNSEKGKRTASASGQTNEIQVITPPYFPGDIITARGHLTTGLYIDDPDYVTQENNLGRYMIMWEDINSGGRQWAVTSSEGQG